VLAATNTGHDEHASSSAAAAAVTAADLAAVLEGQFQLREAVAQLSEQLAVLQQQQPSAALPPPAQPETMARPARSDSAAFLLMVQHELAGVAVAEINSKVDEQSSQVQAAGATATAAMAAAVAAAAAGRASPSIGSRRACRSISLGAAGTAQPTEAEVAAGTLVDLLRSVTALQETVQQLQQQQQTKKADSAKPMHEGEEQQGDVSVSQISTQRAVSTVGVLHAPLSVVVQLQQELDAVREAQVSKEQFAAVVHMVRDLKDPAAEAAAGDVQQQVASLQTHVAAAAAAAAEGRQQAAVVVEAVLQQQDERLAAEEFSIESLLQRMEVTATASVEAMDALIAEQQLQQHCNAAATQQQQEFAAELAALQDTLRQQAAAIETMAASDSAAQQQAGELSSQLVSMQEEQARLSACVDDLAAKVASAVNAAASAVAMPRRIGSEDAAGGSGFGEMVAGLANLKGCLDAQCQTVAAMQQHLDAQEEAVAELAAAALARAEAAAVVLESIEGAATPAAAAGGGMHCDGVVIKAAGSALLRSASSKGAIALKADIAEAGAEMRGMLEQLQAKVSELEFKMQQQEQSQQQQEASGPVLLRLQSSKRSVSGSGCISDAAAAPATAGSPAAIISSLSASRRVSKVNSIAAADAIELTAAAADEAAVAVAGPMSVVHQILTALKKRVEALEATTATTAAAAASTATAVAAASMAQLMHSNALFMPGAPAAAGASVPATPSCRAGTGPRRGSFRRGSQLGGVAGDCREAAAGCGTHCHGQQLTHSRAQLTPG
jgi:hypothetical protein